MMRQLWDDILTRFGQEVTLRGEEAVTCRAIIQPCPHRSGGQEVPGPLGLERQERFRYMGPAEHPLHPDMVVEWKGLAYRVQSAHLMGEDICPHWWAMLSPRDEEAL